MEFTSSNEEGDARCLSLLSTIDQELRVSEVRRAEGLEIERMKMRVWLCDFYPLSCGIIYNGENESRSGVQLIP